MWLFRLPCVTRQGPQAPRIAPVISLTVVLPLLPVMPTTVPAVVAPPARANAVSAASVSGTTTCGTAASTGRLTSAPLQPRSAAWRTKSWRVEALAGERDEQRPGLERAAVGRHRAEGGVGALEPAAGHARELGEVADHASLPSASCTTLRSLNGRTSRPTIW